MPPSEPNPILFNAEGLRPGWAILLYLSLVALVSVLLAAIITPTPHAFTATYVARTEIIGCVAFLAAAALMARLERRPLNTYGLPRTRALLHLFAGLAYGLLFLSALIAVLYLTHHLVFERTLLHGPAATLRGLTWLLAFALVGLEEEFSTRGYLQFTLTRALTGLTRTLAPAFRHAEALAFWLAALILSVGIFMTLHLANSGETPTGILVVGIAGLTFAFSLRRTGSLWWAIGFHTTWDWAQSFLFGVPDSGTLVANRLLATHPAGATLLSGGSAGPEGSLFAIPTLLLVCLILHLTYPRRPRIYTRATA